MNFPLALRKSSLIGVRSGVKKSKNNQDRELFFFEEDTPKIKPMVVGSFIEDYIDEHLADISVRSDPHDFWPAQRWREQYKLGAIDAHPAIPPLTRFEASTALVTSFRNYYNGRGFAKFIGWLAGARITFEAALEELSEVVEDSFICCIAFRASTSVDMVLLDKGDWYLLLNAMQERLPKLDHKEQQEVATKLLTEVREAIKSPGSLLLDGATVTCFDSAFFATIHRNVSGDIQEASSQDAGMLLGGGDRTFGLAA